MIFPPPYPRPARKLPMKVRSQPSRTPSSNALRARRSLAPSCQGKARRGRTISMTDLVGSAAQIEGFALSVGDGPERARNRLIHRAMLHWTLRTAWGRCPLVPHAARAASGTIPPPSSLRDRPLRRPALQHASWHPAACTQLNAGCALNGQPGWGRSCTHDGCGQTAICALGRTNCSRGWGRAPALRCCLCPLGRAAAQHLDCGLYGTHRDRHAFRDSGEPLHAPSAWAEWPSGNTVIRRHRHR